MLKKPKKKKLWISAFDFLNSHTMLYIIALLLLVSSVFSQNADSHYVSATIKSIPDAASIWVGKEEIGTTPAEYNFITPGVVKIAVRKEGYIPWDTTFEAAPGFKFNANVFLERRSIYNHENELNFIVILKKDTTVEGYSSRIKTVEARKVHVDEEIKQILEDFANKYPPLEPKKPDESAKAFQKRHELWNREGMRQVADYQKRHEAYKQKLDRCIATLNDYIVSEQSAAASEIVLTAKVELGAYDPDKELFELTAQDTASEKSPFYFKGIIGVPRDTAKSINRADPGFIAILQFINFPFKTESHNVNLAMSKIQLSRNGVGFNIEGSFAEIERYKSKEGYAPWKTRADSLLSGALKPQGFDYAYVSGRPAAKEIAVDAKAESSGGLGWRGWTRIVTYTLAAGCAGATVFKHTKVEKWRDKDYDDFSGRKKANKEQRLIYGIGAGGFALAGTLTFLF